MVDCRSVPVRVRVTGDSRILSRYRLPAVFPKEYRKMPEENPRLGIRVR